MDAELGNRIRARAMAILELPGVEGDYQKALYVACGVIEELPGELAAEIKCVLTPRLGMVRPKHSRSGKKKHPGNPLPKWTSTKAAGRQALQFKKDRGLSNNKLAAELWLKEIQGIESPPEDLIANLQKRISEAMRQS